MILHKFTSHRYGHLRLLAFSFFAVTVFSNCSKNVNDTPGMPPTALPAIDGSNFVNVSAFGVSTDNPDNSQALQNAITKNEQIYIPAGTYLISKPILKSSGKLFIKGDNVVLKMSPNFPIAAPRFTGAFILNALSEVQITGITVDADRANMHGVGRTWRNFVMGFTVNNSSNVTFTNCAVLNSPSISYVIHHCTNVVMNGCSSINGVYHGVELADCVNTTIDRFTYKGIGNQGNNAAIGGIGILGTVCDHLKITNSLIEDFPDTGTKTEGCEDVTWDGNTVRNSGKDGIKFMNHYADGYYREVGTALNARIINNTVDKIFNGRKDGSSLIQVWNAQNVVVSNNIITGGSKTGLEDGVQVWASTGITKNIVVSNNHILNTNRFIYLSVASDIKIDGNVCENTVDPLTAANGFQAELCKNFSVTRNTFKRHGTTDINGAAVFIYNSSDFSFTTNSIFNANRGLQASFTNSQTIDISKNVWDNLGTYFAAVGVNYANTVHNLLLNDNVVSRVGAGPLLFKINTGNLTIDHLNLSNTRVIGNGLNSRWGIEIPLGGNIAETDLTNFSTSGLALYPQIIAIRGCKKIVGFKSTAAPTLGTWTAGDVVLNLSTSLATTIKGWVCTTSGTPGVWKAIF